MSVLIVKQKLKNRIMKLELKHLAPYLPYGLKGLKRFKDTDLINELDVGRLNGWLEPYSYKPILRPLSDLIKEVNSFLSVPYLDLMNDLHSDLKVYLEDNGELFIIDKCNLNMFHISYTRVFDDFLLEHHFDVFGLIEKGLAIDINTLK